MADGLNPGSAVGGAPPDLMNDPQYATNTANGEDGTGDAETCRICRGEGSDTEPLFHPCKCSGSIKYVHQDCLMEWLSHSQKKHCELCKTAFRFTKLYSPNMPHTLPIHVLFRHVIIHTVKNITTWLRFCLVVTVWLGFLPYIIRQVWRLLFWFSDGGWPPNYLAMESTRNSTAIRVLEMARELEAMPKNGTSPVTPFLASQTTSASMGGIISKLVDFLAPVSHTWNISGTDPLAAGLFKSVFNVMKVGTGAIPEGPETNASISQLPTASRSTSLLSEISFLRNLTRNSHVNQLIIMIAEGYIITILVVVCFILVFLIREWVVQQQPGINMGAGFNAEFAAPERPREQQALPEPRPLAIEGDFQEPREIGQRPMARPRRRNPQFGDGDDVRPARQNGEPRNGTDFRTEAGPYTNRPTPARDALSPAAEIQRALAEEPRMTEEFLAIWRRAESDPKEVLRIIETENKGDQLRYWVNAMKLLQSPSQGSQALPTTSSELNAAHSHLPTVAITNNGTSEVPAITFTSSGNSSTDDLRKPPGSDGSRASSESWVNIPKPLALQQHNNTIVESHPVVGQASDSQPLDKGKSRAMEDPSLPQDEVSLNENTRPEPISFTSVSSNNPWTPSGPVSFSSSSSRPRATSDGPRIKDNINANNWSFSNLPDDDIVEYKFSWNKADNLPSEPLLGGPSPASSASQYNFQERQVHDSQAWKIAQDLRVQQAIARGREAHKTALAGHERSPAIPLRMSQNGAEPTTIEREDLVKSSSHEMAAPLDPVIAELAEISDSDSEPDLLEETAATNILPDEQGESVVVRPPEPQGVLANVADFLWGGVGDERPQDDQGANDEHIVQDLAAEAPFVPVVHQDPFDQGGEFAEQDREVVEAALAAGIDPNDQDAIDDAEDFEGIMELVGMRGPVFSLVQNALFSAFLLALTVAFGVWIPYNIGRVSLLLLANPGPAFKLPLRLIFGLAALMQDLGLSLMGIVSYCLLWLFSVPLSMFYSVPGVGIRSAALNVSQSALERVMDSTVNSLVHIGDSEIFAFSAASHESLIYLQNLVIETLVAIGATVTYIFLGDYDVTRASIWAIVVRGCSHAWQFVSAVPGFLARSESWVISLEVGKRSSPLDLELSVWDGMDRFWAIVAGYTALSLLGALYVKKGSPFSSGPVGREWEATIIDLLNQAGGVMKVILIISIEMLVFPLYCGLLLDAALLPLFDNTTIVSRILFTFKSPLTSIFVHWFVGTCYMFHFALFVSMCRKIMRKGVLCKFCKTLHRHMANRARLHPRPG